MSLMNLDGAIQNPNDEVGQITNDDGGFAKASEWVQSYGEGFLFEFQIVNAIWRNNPTYNNDTGQYDGEPEKVVTAEIVNSNEDTFLIDVRNSNRKLIVSSLGLDKSITPVEFLTALIGQNVNISAKFWKGVQSYGFVIDIAREASKEMKPVAKKLQPTQKRRTM